MAFTYYSPVPVNHTKVPSTQTNFPVLISYTDARFKTTGNGGHVLNASGFDIRPYSDTGLTSALTYELVSYDGTNGIIQMNVLISSLSSSSDTNIYLAYGNSSLTTDGTSNTTWDSNFVGVWHMEDNAATTTIKDWSQGAHNATNVANTSGKTVAGKVGNALTYNGSSDGSSSAIDLSASDIVTISAWVKWTTNANTDNLLFEYTPNYNSTSGFLADWNAADGSFEFGSSGAGSVFWTDDFTRPSTGTFHLVHLVYNRTQGSPVNKAYLDGVSQSLSTHTHNSITGHFANSTLYFMSRNKASLFAAGVLDEVRLSKTERAQDWITCEFNNQNAPTTFAVLGTEVPVGGASVNSNFLMLM